MNTEAERNTDDPRNGTMDKIARRYSVKDESAKIAREFLKKDPNTTNEFMRTELAKRTNGEVSFLDQATVAQVRKELGIYRRGIGPAKVIPIASRKTVRKTRANKSAVSSRRNDTIQVIDLAKELSQPNHKLPTEVVAATRKYEDALRKYGYVGASVDVNGMTTVTPRADPIPVR
jgi:hypothetical protein